MERHLFRVRRRVAAFASLWRNAPREPGEKQRLVSRTPRALGEEPFRYSAAPLDPPMSLAKSVSRTTMSYTMTSSLKPSKSGLDLLRLVNEVTGESCLTGTRSSNGASAGSYLNTRAGCSIQPHVLARVVCID